ncbi:hypothetical protein D3875_19755 [Deinococcus cavernae]|uniref:Uncharacterized protein n=1 Tax=Deinococcus cavernae TaxID=2320857 RepID=A0A418VBC6_9DEIO|nr:hypothetical protein [Deinococcus cavernae]RJF73445.1 hypothetical protein D3875_19755 [Deinococcus cavernae]
MDWPAALRDLRAHLPPSGPGGGVQRGSLRWLEAEMQRRGANPAALRNIIYRDTGLAADKAVLSAILADLAREAGRSLDLPAQRSPAALPDELELLGRTKKRLYKQFVAGLTAGRAPRLAIHGKRGSGKTVLLGQVAQAAELLGLRVTRLNLSGDVFHGAVTVPPVATGRSFAALAEQQQVWIRGLLPTDGVVLLRVTADLKFADSPPRAPDGQAVTSAGWAAHVLHNVPAGVAALLALEDQQGWPADAPPLTEIRPPTPSEARTYLIQKLGVTRQAAQELLKETGRNLDHLTLLTGAGGSVTQLLTDPPVRRLAASLQALRELEITAPFPDQLLQAALGQEVAALPLHARAQLSGHAAGGWSPNPTLQRALPAVPAPEVLEAARRLARQPASSAAALAALAFLHEWTLLAQAITRHPDAARFLPELWPRIRRDAPTPERELLARAVVTHHAGRGEYGAPRARDALLSLLESEVGAVRIWARVKLAESSLDAGNFTASEEQLAHPDVQAALHLPLDHRADPWLLAAQADALLVQAALARWQGDMDAATRAVQDSRAASSGPRVHLWRGLIAKDAGRWPEALQNLQAVPDTSPLLHARARYQEGDLRLRLGQPGAALGALLDAATRLEAAGGTPEEQARILARTATAQRRLGHPGLALECSRQGLQLLAPADRQHDRVLRARLLSEQIPILLALNRPGAAFQLAGQALALLAQSQARQAEAPYRQAEAQYRQRRTHYRVALTYLTRGLGVPYLQPLCGPEHDHPDLQQARELLDALLTRLPDRSDREQVLTFDMRLSRALAEPDAAQALEHLARALDMTDHPYAEAQARAIRADALLRQGHADAALTEINRAHALLRRVQAGLPGNHEAATHEADPALHAGLLALEARATIHEGQRTFQWLRSALADPGLHPFRPGVWRETGRALEPLGEHGRALVLALHPALITLPMRLRDALPLLEIPGE